MARKRYTEEQIIAVLNEAEAGAKTAEGHVPSSGVRVRHPVDVV